MEKVQKKMLRLMVFCVKKHYFCRNFTINYAIDWVIL